ncbi:MAG: lipopolysaccharide heptosyltransferase II [Sulfurimicrobium sp.]|jgi:heptosyltransferase-2|nr:lipopolysaccharide heptosyltransferase II [Sulfurimicrobium sp.]
MALHPYKILIVAPSWVGDMVMAQPLFMRLHQLHPGLHLDVLAPAWTLPLLARMAEVHEAIANPFGHGEFKLSARYQLGKTLRQKQYDQAIVLPNSLKSALVPFFAGIPRRTGYLGEMRWGLLNDARKLDKDELPLMVERFVALAERPGSPLPAPIPQPKLAIDEQQRLATLIRLGLKPEPSIAALCVGAEYGPAKRWPAAHFAELGKLLRQEGYQVWLVGSAKDAEAGAEAAHLSAGACLDLCGKTSLNEAVDLLASASVIVSNDSGLMHVAAALGKPLVALYGSSSPGFTPPLSHKARILSLNLPCSPCFKRECPLGHLDCLMKLTPQRVLEQISTTINEENHGSG